MDSVVVLTDSNLRIKMNSYNKMIHNVPLNGMQNFMTIPTESSYNAQLDNLFKEIPVRVSMDFLTTLNCYIMVDIIDKFVSDKSKLFRITSQCHQFCKEIKSQMMAANEDNIIYLSKQLEMDNFVEGLSRVKGDLDNIVNMKGDSPSMFEFVDSRLIQETYISLDHFVEVVKEFIRLLKVSSADYTELPKFIDLSLNVENRFHVFFRIVTQGGNYHLLTKFSKSTAMASYKLKASRAEYMTLLINSLSHELVTPLTEIIQLTDSYINPRASNPNQKSMSKITDILDNNPIYNASASQLMSTDGDKMIRADTGSSLGTKIMSRIS